MFPATSTQLPPFPSGPSWSGFSSRHRRHHQAARGLAVAFFFLNLFLSYKLFRERGPRWVGLLAVTLLVTSPFLYCFSRLAILEPLLIALTLGAMNLAMRLPRFRHQRGRLRAVLGLLFTAMMLTKTTAVFLLPALVWIIALPSGEQKRKLLRMLVAAGGTSALSFSLWMLVVINYDLFADFKYLFFINVYDKPHGLWGRLLSFWWSFHGGLWADLILIPLAGLLILAASHAAYASAPNWRSNWTGGLWRDPLFSGSVLVVAGYIGFMTYQNHPQPRYYVVVAFFSFFVVVRVTAQLLYQAGQRIPLPYRPASPSLLSSLPSPPHQRRLDPQVCLPSAIHLGHRRQNLTRYIDEHPNGNRLLVSISGDEITLITHLPTLCDDFGTQDLPDKLAHYQPGWYATWNDLDPGTLEDLHVHFSLEQVASFPAFDDPDRNVLSIQTASAAQRTGARSKGKNLQSPLPDDKIDIPIE
jgi:hypothetical protein